MKLSAITALAAILAVPAMADAPKGYLTVPGTDTAIQVYGRATFDLVHDFVQPNGVLIGLSGADATSNGTYTPGGDDARPKSQWDMTMCQSRFGLRTVTPSSYGDVKTRFELDFNGTNKDSAGNPHTGEYKNYAHVRQMYGEMNGFLFGKTDSNFMDPDGSPNYIDQDGLLADDYGVGRVNMVKYSHEFGKMNLNVSFEQNSVLAVGGAGSTMRRDMPGSLVGRFGYTDKWGHVSFSGAWAKFSSYDAATDHSDKQDTFSWTLSGHFQFGDDSLVWQFGRGIGQYGAGLQDSVIKQANGNLQSIYSRQGLIGFEHFWTSKVHSNVFGSVVKYQDSDKAVWEAANTDGANVAHMFKSYTQIGVNTMWNPTRTSQYTLEYIWGAAKTADGGVIVKPTGGTSDAIHESKLHFQARFNFN